MSAEMLRKAAALMRERAEAAYPRTRGLCDDWFDEGASDLAHLRPQEAEHIASWHPDVALPVADLLERVAANWGIARLGYWSTCATEIARVYLGGDA